MPKGLLDKETTRLLADSVEEGSPLIPHDFWCYDSLSEKEACCFWHYIFYPNRGPERDGTYHPCYKYETNILEALQEHKLVAVYKATGLGITEFMLLWILWKCFTDPFFNGKKTCIITGPNVDLAKELIERTKDFLIKRGLDYIDHGAYELEVNGSRIECFPSNNIHSARGIPKVALFFGDESAFFKLRDDSIVRTVGERYIGKSNSWVVWVSTAGEEPAGFFYDILQEPEHECQYKRIEMYENEGLRKDKQTGTSIFTKEYIDEASKLRSFEREYQGVWGKNVGDIFDPIALEEISKTEYSILPSDDSFDRVVGIDPGFGSSEFGVVACQILNKKKTVVYAEGFERESTSHVTRKVNEICKMFKTKKVFCDSANPEIIKELRDTYHLNVVGVSMKDVYGAKITHYASDQVNAGNVAIHPRFRKLKQQLMTIKTKKDKEIPDKTPQNPFDLGDAFLLAMWYYKMGSGVIISAGVG